MSRLSVVFFLAVSSSLPLFSQTDRAEVFGGYSLEDISPGCGSDYTCGAGSNTGATTNFNGWAASVTGYFYKSLGLTAQLAGNYASNVKPSDVSLHRYTIQFGPQYAIRWRHASFFAHRLFSELSIKRPLHS